LPRLRFTGWRVCIWTIVGRRNPHEAGTRPRLGPVRKEEKRARAKPPSGIHVIRQSQPSFKDSTPLTAHPGVQLVCARTFLISSSVGGLGRIVLDLCRYVFRVGDLPAEAIGRPGNACRFLEISLGEVVGRSVIVFVHAAEEEYDRDALAREIVAVGAEVKFV